MSEPRELTMEELRAGPELNALVEHRLFGRECRLGVGGIYWHLDGTGFPGYSNNLASAERVIERLNLLGYDVILFRLADKNEPAECRLERQEWSYDECQNGPWACGGTLPEAICRAALLATASTRSSAGPAGRGR